MSELQTNEERPRRRHRKRAARGRRIFLWTALTIVCALVLIAVKPAFHWFKSTRSAQLAALAENLFKAGKWDASAEKYRAALQLDPVGYPALQGAARLATKLDRPEAIDLWEQVVKSRYATASDRQQYVDQLLQNGRPKIAAGIIENLLKAAPDAKTFELASRYERRFGVKNKALEFARLALKTAPNDDLRFQLAELLAGSSKADQRAEARKILWDLALEPGSYRQRAVDALGRAPDLSDEERERVLQILTESPASMRNALLAADLRLQLHPDDASQIYDEVAARGREENVSELVDLARWLASHQQPERVLSLFSVKSALGNNQLLLTRLDALASLRRWNEVDDVLSRPDLTFDPSVLECFRARSAQQQDSSLDAELHWDHAMALAASDPTKLRFIANFAEQSHAPAVALKVYAQLAKFPEQASVAYYGIERLSGRQGDLSVQKHAAEKIAAISPSDPNAEAQLAYLNLLAGTGIEANTEAAKRLVQKYPDRLSFRVTAALGFLRQHDAGQALAQFQGPRDAPPIEWDKTPAPWRAVYGAALLANEQYDSARALIKTINTEQLNPEERALIEGK